MTKKRHTSCIHYLSRLSRGMLRHKPTCGIKTIYTLLTRGELPDATQDSYNVCEELSGSWTFVNITIGKQVSKPIGIKQQYGCKTLNLFGCFGWSLHIFKVQNFALIEYQLLCYCNFCIVYWMSICSYYYTPIIVMLISKSFQIPEKIF